MKIKIINVPPVDPKHGLFKGRIYDAEWEQKQRRRKRDEKAGAVNIISDVGETVTLLRHEFFILEEPTP